MAGAQRGDEDHFWLEASLEQVRVAVRSILDRQCPGPGVGSLALGYPILSLWLSEISSIYLSCSTYWQAKFLAPVEEPKPVDSEQPQCFNLT